MKFLKKKWKQLAEYVNSRGLQFVISVSFTLVALVGMVFIGGFLLQSYGNATEEMVRNDSRQLIDQVEINLNNYLRSMMRISDAMYYNVIKKVDLGQDNISQELNLLYESNKDNLVSVACFNEEGSLLGAAPVGTLKKNVDLGSQKWFTSAENQMENLHFSELHVENIFENSSGRYYWVVSLSRGVELTNRGRMSGGILLVDMNFSGIRQLFTKVNSQGLGYVYLINSDGDIIYHPKQNLIFSSMMKENNKTASQYDDGVYDETFQGEDRTVIVKTVGYTGWKIVSVTPKKIFYQNANRTRIVAGIMLLLSIFLMIFANQFVAVRVARPMKKLEDSLKGIGVDKEPEIYIGGPPEIQHLGQTILSMVEQLRELTDDIVKEQEEKRKSELDALQSQINPHFLYNTLDTIMWLVAVNENEKAIEMIESLSVFFKTGLSKGMDWIPVEREIEHVKSYLYIQQSRYSDILQYVIDISPDMIQYDMLKMTLQPIVENAIYHGIKNKENGGSIIIKGNMDGKFLSFLISDTGVGMEAEAVTKLNERMQENKISYEECENGFGLYNVNRRIKLYCGEESGITVESQIEEGTKVHIRMLAIRREEHKNV